ncbi:MAG: hypothetical protein ACLQG5_11965 [Methanobacterium sp.]|jgi:hydrogenase-4 component E
MNLITELIYMLSAATLLTAFYILLQPFIQSMIRTIITQSVVIGLISFAMAYYLRNIDFILLGLLVIFLRGFLVSYLLERQIPKRKELFREYTKGTPSTLLTALIVAVVGIFIVYFYVFSNLITDVAFGTNNIIVFPFVVIFLGIFQILARRNTLAHVIGYVEQENGIVLMSIFLIPVPFIVELTVFLDVIALVLIASIVARETSEHKNLEELRG